MAKKEEKDATRSATAVLEREPDEAEKTKPEVPKAEIADKKEDKKKGKKDEKDIDEYEVEFNTPFGKIEFEFEPKSAKERKDRERKEKAEREAAKAAVKAEKQALKAAKKGKSAEAKGGSRILPILLIFGIIAAAVIIAYWLFARPGDEDEIPAEFRNEPTPEPIAEPQGFVAKAQHRIKDAVRSGRQASREAQREQEQRFHDLTHQ